MITKFECILTSAKTIPTHNIVKVLVLKLDYSVFVFSLRDYSGQPCSGTETGVLSRQCGGSDAGRL